MDYIWTADPFIFIDDTHTHPHSHQTGIGERKRDGSVGTKQRQTLEWGQREREMPFAGYDWHWLACPNVFGKFAFPCPNFGFQSAPLRPQIQIEKLINLVLVVTWNTNTPDPPLPPSQLLSAFCACVCVFLFLFWVQLEASSTYGPPFVRLRRKLQLCLYQI